MPTAVDRLQGELDAYLALRSRWRVDPERYVRDRLGVTPTHHQRALLEAIAPDGARVTVRAGHDTGKTTGAAMCLLWFLETREYSRIPCTAPTAYQLRVLLWAELAKLLRLAETQADRLAIHPRFRLGTNLTLIQDKLYDNGAPDEWFAVARTARKESPEALQGFHALDVDLDPAGRTVTRQGDASLLFLVDEASGVPDIIFEVAEGALATPGARVLLVGNPTRNTGYFAASHKAQRGEWTPLHFRSQDSPLCDPDYRPGLVRKFGDGSNVVGVRADGEFPQADDDALIPLEWAEAPLDRDMPDDERTEPRRLGLDVARYGADRITYVLRQGPVVPHAAIDSHQDTMETVGKAVLHAEQWQADEIDVDVIGIGAGVYDRLVEVMAERRARGLWSCGVVAVNVAEAAPPKAPTDDFQAYRVRDYVWMQMRQWLRDEEPVFAAPDRRACNDLAGELSTPTFRIDSSGRLVVESKDEMKKRLGHSPDLADALGCTFPPPAAQKKKARAGGW